jgi:hypothetical protein
LGALVDVVVKRQRRVLRRVASIGQVSAGAEGTHHGRHQDDQPKEKGLIFHKHSRLEVIICRKYSKSNFNFQLFTPKYS